jgi:hypothetical protein
MKHFQIANVTLEGAGTTTYLLRVPQHNDFEYANIYAQLTGEGSSLGTCTWQLLEEDGSTAISAPIAWDSRGSTSAYSNGVAAAPYIRLSLQVTGSGESPDLKVDALLAKV